MKIGDKVICIDFSVNPYYGFGPPLLPNHVYVINQLSFLHGVLGLNLIGVNPPATSKMWRASRFRLLDELKLSKEKRNVGERHSHKRKNKQNTKTK